MRLELNKGFYKSIMPFVWDNIPDFVVMTGQNGTGKTQLLELINHHLGSTEKHKIAVGNNPNDPFYTSKEFTCSEAINYKEITFIPYSWNTIRINHGSHQNLNSVISSIHGHLTNRKNNSTQFEEIASLIKSKTGKNYDEISRRDIQENLPIDYYDFINKVQLFEGLAEAYHTYHLKSAELKTQDIDESEIIKRIGEPPWQIINDTLNKANFPYYTMMPQSIIGDYQFELVSKKDSSLIIKYEDLSSGEKVLLSLSVWIYNSTKEKRLPKLLLWDEPDAHLHPSAVKELLVVLSETLVKKFKIRVIITTHSPSTIALCPDDSIFELKRNSGIAVENISKDKALQILTGNLPMLSIDYENHKQVFVESPTDVSYFQTLFNKLNQENYYSSKLYFISNSAGKGNCTQVINIVNSIRQSGNKTSFGIIDWDLKNAEGKFIKVHGLAKRYSIENYIYDPIYITMLLLNQKANNVHNELRIDKAYNEYHLINESTEFLQNISNWFFDKYYGNYKVIEEEKSRLETIEYFNGKGLKVPKWYLESRGHDLEPRIKQMFSALEGKFRSEGDLQKELILTMGKSYPFIPMDSARLIENIVSY